MCVSSRERRGDGGSAKVVIHHVEIFYIIDF